MIGLRFEELGDCRQENGYINLDLIITKQVEFEREVRGNDQRVKDWFDIKDSRVMFKANSEHQPYAHYSELICCELAKQVGLETAQYDIAEYHGDKGVITKDVCAPGEEILTVNELIGHGPTNPDYPDSTDIYFVFDNLEEKLISDGYDDMTVDNCMLQLRKQLLFDMYVMETDRHTENLSFIIGKDSKTGKPNIRLAPMYDTEAALALSDDVELMNRVASDIGLTANVTNMQEPKLCVIPKKEELESFYKDKTFIQMLQSQVGESYATESEEIWKTTLDFLIEDERACEFLEKQLNNMDIRKAIESLENSKKINVPEEVKNMSISAFEDRKLAIYYEMGLDMEYEQEKLINDIELT